MVMRSPVAVGRGVAAEVAATAGARVGGGVSSRFPKRARTLVGVGSARRNPGVAVASASRLFGAGTEPASSNKRGNAVITSRGMPSSATTTISLRRFSTPPDPGGQSYGRVEC